MSPFTSSSTIQFKVRDNSPNGYRICIVSFFVGFGSGHHNAEPTGTKVDKCMYLSSVYNASGSGVDVGYMFWNDQRCESTRRRLVGGFQYLCERPLERQDSDVGKYSLVLFSRSQSVALPVID